MLTCVQHTSIPDISMATYQVERFCISIKLSHEQAVHRIGRYLKAFQDTWIIFRPDAHKGLECYVDAEFAGGWDKVDPRNPKAVLVMTGHVLMYANCSTFSVVNYKQKQQYRVYIIESISKRGFALHKFASTNHFNL